MIESLVLLLEKNKAERMIAAGKVTGSNINKVVSSGGARSVDTHLTGLDKGTDNILRKHNAIEKNGLLGKIAPVTKPGTFGNPTTIHVPKRNSGSISAMIRGKTLFHSSDLTPAIRRHEADEVRSLNKRHKNSFMSSMVDFRHNGKQVGQHASPKVLQREYDHVSYLSKLNPRYANFEKWRQKSGEYGPKVLNLNNRQTRKVEINALKHGENALISNNSNSIYKYHL